MRTRSIAFWAAATMALTAASAGLLGYAVAIAMAGASAQAAPIGLSIHAAVGMVAAFASVVLAGLIVRCRLIVPIRRLNVRARALLRLAGRASPGGGGEIEALESSVDALNKALIAQSDRLRHAHASGLQHGLELQRQSALMRLLRGLAAAANETDEVEEALQRALREVGDYLDWPIGRVLFVSDADGVQRSFWYVRDAQAYAQFVEHSEQAGILASAQQFIGRAQATDGPLWVADLATLTDWNRRDAAAAAGLQTGLAVPVLAHGHATAFIEFFSEQRVEATVASAELLDTIAEGLARIAERHRAERELQSRAYESRRLALVASNTASLVIITDPACRIEWVNASFTRVTGYTAAEAVGRSVAGLLRGPQTDPAAAARIDEALRAGVGVRGVQILNYAKDRTPYWVETEIQPVFNARGALTNFVAIENEISDRKRAETELRASEEYFRALFDESPVACVIQDAELRIRKVNAAFERLLGYAQDEVAGIEAAALVHPDDAARMQVAHCGLRDDAGTGPQVFELRYVSRDGRHVWTRLQALRFSDRNGAASQLCVMQDITEARNHERALLEAKEIAETASQAKSQFLANMSHELRTPMNGVLGMTELLLGTHLTGKQRRFAEAVYRSGETLLEIINDILDLSKIEAGKLSLESVDFNLRMLVEDVFELLAPRAHEKRLELACRIGPEVPAVVVGDPTRLRQILTNLVGNAIKFTERGEIVVSVAAEAAGARHRVRFEVRDTGIGMSAEAVAKLFTVFMQADQRMSRRYGGTGLGLAISRQLVELMGGTINVASRVGEGSVFSFDALLAGGDAAAVATPLPAERLAGKRVLLVEDNLTNRSIVQAQLQGFGMQVATAENGAQALELLRAASRAAATIDVAVIDMKMPVMDGLTLANEMRRDPQLAGIRLVMLTSLADGNEAQLAHATGIEVHLVKPVRQQELMNALATVLGTRPAEGAARAAAQRFNGLAVLLAEDNPVNQEVTRVMLEEVGCTVHVADDGRRALEAMGAQRFDIVLMDCQMPEMDGFETVARLRDRGDVTRQLSTKRDVPVIALTANALVGDAERCLAGGFSDYLAKPFKQQQLLDLVNHWMGKDRWLRPVAATAVPTAAVPRTEPAATGSATLDAAVLDRVRAMESRGAARLLERLIATYQTTAAKLLTDGEAALARGDGPALRHAAHTLKSSSANVGALDLAQRCGEVEAFARDGQVARAGEAWLRLRDEFARVARALQDLDCGVPVA